LEIETPTGKFDHFPGFHLIISGERLDIFPELEELVKNSSKQDYTGKPDKIKLPNQENNDTASGDWVVFLLQ
jgi:hypothetical protein